MQRYSILNLARHALQGHREWRRNFGGRPLRKSYDVVIVGGGGHGLATAYYLAKNHSITNVAGVITPKGPVAANTVLVSVAGHSSLLAIKAGFTLPLESFPVQAFVSEPLKPVINTVVNFNMGLAYINQTDKGELVMGGGIEPRNGYLSRGGFDRIEDTVARIIAMFPFLSRVRLMRTWAGIADIPMDGSPLLGESPVGGLLFNCGWGYAGFKATPAAGWTMADTIAHGRAHPLAKPFGLSRFREGYSHDEGGVGPTPSLH